MCAGEAEKQRWKDVQQAGVMEDRDGIVMTGSTSAFDCPLLQVQYVIMFP